MALISVWAVLAVSCSTDSTDSTTTLPVVGSTTAPGSVGEVPGEDEIFRVGLIGPITTDNWFAALDGSANTEANQAVVTNSKLALFAPSLPGFTLIPRLAATAEPVEPVQDGDSWIVDQPIREDVTWSDGTPVTSEDLAFYFDTVRELGLGSDHSSRFREVVRDVVALDDHIVRVVFSARPGLADWEAGIALASFVPAHFWRNHVEDAKAAATAAMAEVTVEEATQAIVAASLGDDDVSNDITPGEVSQAQIDRYIDDLGAGAARSHLYGVSAVDEPSIGPVILDRWEGDAEVVGLPNPGYPFSNSETTLYSDGSLRLANADAGTDEVFGGSGSGDILAHYVEGPFFSEIRWVANETRQEAYESLANGEVDYVLDTTGITSGVRDQLALDPDMRFTVSEAEGFRYMAFNMRRPPMSDPAFRTAMATVIDKEVVAERVLGGAVIPAYTMIHPDLTASHDPGIGRPGWADGAPMTEDQRLLEAMGMLEEAGYTWVVEPVVNYNEDGDFVSVTPGEGLTLPNGVRVPELSLLAPGASYDPYRATFAIWIEHWANALGIPLVVEQTDFDAIVDAAFPPQTPDSALAWDMYMLGWGAPDPLLPGASLRAFFHSDQDSVFFGGFNTPGYASDEFDAVAEAFDAAATLGEAAQLTRRMDSILAADLPYVVLFRAPIIEAHTSRVQFPVPSIAGGHGAYPNAWPNAVAVGD